MDPSRMTTDSRDDASVSMSIAGDGESEWIAEDEPGVYITIRQLVDGTRELRRVRFRYFKISTLCIWTRDMIEKAESLFCWNLYSFWTFSYNFLFIHTVGRSLGRCTQSCGGNRTEREYNLNTFKSTNFYPQNRRIIPWKREIFCLLDVMKLKQRSLQDTYIKSIYISSDRMAPFYRTKSLWPLSNFHGISWSLVIHDLANSLMNLLVFL